MEEIGTVALILIVANLLFSYNGFKKPFFLDAYKFETDAILVHKEYKRLFTSGFLHVSWTHLLFNMLSLSFFSKELEMHLGLTGFALVYFAGLLGGSMLSLYIHRNHGDYNAVGASGAVCGIVFASIALFPTMEIKFFMIPVALPGWLYGIGYVIFSIYGIRSQKDNIGHDAHLGGAMIGMLMALVLRPVAFVENYLVICAIAIPGIVFIYLIAAKPYLLFINGPLYREKSYADVDYKYNEDKVSRQKELDRLLDKINQKGMASLSKKERQKLEEYSKK